MTEAARELNADTEPAILDAASILLVDDAGPDTRVLMGLRQASNVFLPNKWVFPGGRLEPGDATAASAGELDPGDAHALLHDLVASTPANAIAKALAHAAVRELFEETGHALALRQTEPASGVDQTGLGAGWHALGLMPYIVPLRFMARAITPPGRPRRYDTRFFIARRQDAIENAATADGEFADLAWFTIAQAQALDLPIITRRILADLEDLLKSQEEPGAIPFYYEHAGTYRRDLIARYPAPA
jgi:8-oxo-dGTP pyrophosphatase MutT (NUDIX family)